MKQRIVTGVIAGAAFLLLLVLGGLWFTSLIVLLAAIGYSEYNRMNRLPPAHPIAWFGWLGVLALTFPWEAYPDLKAPGFESTVWLLLFLLFAATVLSKNKVTLDGIALVFIGAVYIGMGFHYMVLTRLGEHGLYGTLLTFACIWASDSGAYFAGRAFGRRPLWPAISPKKTIEGAAGGIVAAMVVALCFSAAQPDLLPWGNALGFGFVVAVVGQLGDLIQSAYKRIRGIKDTGAILPGHGGVLDRCDSWLIVFPFVHLFSLIPHG